MVDIDLEVGGGVVSFVVAIVGSTVVAVFSSIRGTHQHVVEG